MIFFFLFAFALASLVFIEARRCVKRDQDIDRRIDYIEENAKKLEQIYAADGRRDNP